MPAMATKAAGKMRLDVALVERGLAATRGKAQSAVLAGEVYVNGVRAGKPGITVAADAQLEIRSRRPAFVSRGGLKLDYALATFGLDVTGRRAADVGSSTGGFTDCLLRRGAARVYAIDVGKGQLDLSLRYDPRVAVLEQRDVRHVSLDELDGPVDVATVDVSFISLGKVLPAVRSLVARGGTVVALVKPQFEAGPKAAKRGVVRDAAVHGQVLRRVIAQAEGAGLSVIAATYSPVAGPDGNLEFFLLLENVSGRSHPVGVEAVVAAAHGAVRRKGERAAR